MRFILNPETDVIKDNPTLKMTEHLSQLQNRDIKWIMLVYDYDSPLSQMPLETRKIKAGKMVGFAFVGGGTPTGSLKLIIDGKNQKIINAVKEYHTLQFDENQEALKSYNDQLSQYRKFLSQKDKKTAEIKLAITLQKELPGLLRARDEIAKLVGLRAEEEDFESNDSGDLSTIDKIIYEEENLKDHAS